MFKPDYKNEVYVVAIQEPTGGLIQGSRCWADYALAEAELKKDRDQGIKYTRIFTLVPHRVVKPTPKYL
jgi:hypothetical protein